MDHAGGAEGVLRAFPDTLLVVGPDVDRSAALTCHAGESWTWDQVRFRFLHPPLTSHGAGNDSSCVLRVDGVGGSLLLTGDIERHAERDLVAASAELAADVVVVPHHGSRTSSSQAFVEAVRPTLAVVPAGFRNRWDLPDAGVVGRWQAQGAVVWVTGEVGGVQFIFDEAGARLERLGRRPRYWHTHTSG